MSLTLAYLGYGLVAVSFAGQDVGVILRSTKPNGAHVYEAASDGIWLGAFDRQFEAVDAIKNKVAF